jgi:hypothetical protein
LTELPHILDEGAVFFKAAPLTASSADAH